MDHEAVLGKLRAYLKTKHPELTETEISERANKYYELAQFCVRLWLKRQDSTSKNHTGKEKEINPTHPPP